MAIDAPPAAAEAVPPLTRADFESDQIVRWCPGCGDYAILAQMQRTLPEIGVAAHNVVFISGIGCSSRFPYYMDTYGIHSVHGRAPALATGLKASRPDLDVWVVTGDGDALSIGGNHLLHICRRNVDVNILLFNNQIYGLTKGQYSPTSPIGTRSYSTPTGSIDAPFNPLRIAIAANASFIARAIDRDLKHLSEMIKRAHAHRGTALLEIYQDCIVFNKGAFAPLSDKASKEDRVIYLHHGEPMIFGKTRDKGIRLDGLQPRVVSLDDGAYGTADLLVHDEDDEHGTLADIIASFQEREDFPRPLGVVRDVERVCYEDVLEQRVADAVEERGEPSLQELFETGDTWEVPEQPAS
jgi:2-oxoglutarate ferredoxin oxidoreductase subunit beta